MLHSAASRPKSDQGLLGWREVEVTGLLFWLVEIWVTWPSRFKMRVTFAWPKCQPLSDSAVGHRVEAGIELWHVSAM